MRFLSLLTALALTLPNANPPATHPLRPGDQDGIVKGRIEIVNPKVRLRGGEADAGGVAVWLSPLKGAPRKDHALQPKPRLEQKDKRFIPHVMVIQTGTEVDFPNNDPFFHNVFSIYEGKTFDLGL
jgi:hypothetical protein